MKKIAFIAAAAAASLSIGAAPAFAAHQHVDTPNGACHDTASQAGPNSGGKAQWSKNADNRANANSPVISAGTCAASE